jgi:6-pyruvoyltetrahydropterin/6-carboxytetrahydropterin synthase
MYSVSRDIHFCYGHRLMNYDGKCQHPHGHNGKARIELESGKLDERGMVCDFGDIKKAVQTWIHENLDHRMILRKDDPMVKFLKDSGEPYFLMDENPTAEAIAKLIFDHAMQCGLPVSAVRLWETEQSYAVYRSNSIKVSDHLSRDR